MENEEKEETIEEFEEFLEKEKEEDEKMKAIVIFKKGVQTHMVFNMSFEKIKDITETEVNLDFIEFNKISVNIPNYIEILGKTLIKTTISLYKTEGIDNIIIQEIINDIIDFLNGLK